MDKRLGASLALAALLAGGLYLGNSQPPDPIPGSYRGGYYSAGVNCSYRGGGGAASWDTIKVVLSSDVTYVTNKADSLKSGGGDYDIIINSDDAPDAFLRGMCQYNTDASSPNANYDQVTIYASGLFVDWNIAMFASYFPLQELPSYFFHEDTEVIVSEYRTFWRLVGPTMAEGDTLFVIGGNLEDLNWAQHGTEQMNRNYIDLDDTVSWPYRGAGNIPRLWNPTGHDVTAFSDLDYSDHPILADDYGPVVSNSEVVWDVTPWMQGQAEGDFNGGLWHAGVRNGGGSPSWRFNNHYSIPPWRSPRLIIEFRVKSSLVAASKLINYDLPVYAHWGWGTFQDPITSADYDWAAEHDVFHLPSDGLESARFSGFVDSVRTRNPDCSVLTYLHVYGVSLNWSASTPGSYYRDIYDYAISDPDVLTRNGTGPPGTPGNIVRGTTPGLDQYIFFNPTYPALAETLISIWYRHTNKLHNDRHHVGPFADYLAAPDWALFACVDSLQYFDWDQDGTERGTSGAEYEKEKAFYATFVSGLAEAWRDYMGEVDPAVSESFLIVPNIAGSRPTTLSTHGSDWDGSMYEAFQVYYPTENQTQIEQAFANGRTWLSDDRIYPPLLMVQGGEKDTWHLGDNGTGVSTTEVLAAMGMGVSSWHLVAETNYTLPDRLVLGTRTSGPTWDGDIITAEFSSGVTIKVLQELADASGTNLPWDFIVFNLAADEVYRRVGSWPIYDKLTGY